MKVPNIYHFIFGLIENFGGKPFSLVHYLAIKSAYDVNNPENIYLYYKYKPSGEWWEKAKEFVQMVEVEPPTEIFGNPLLDFAHQSDILRYEILLKHGGIYLDLDIICLKSLKAFYKYDFTMGMEGGYGLSNAVMIAKPKAEFLEKWYQAYRSFRSKGRDRYWNEHSVHKSLQIANENPELIHIEKETSFCWPHFSNPAPLWGHPASGIFDGFRAQLDKILFKRSYCIHLWETFWWNNYLKDLSAEKIRKNKNNFAKLCARFL